MIAKGLDFPEITLVGIINADLGLHIPDFRSSERTFQLIYQAAGRSGRGGKRGEVIIQTYDKENLVINAASKLNIKDYQIQHSDGKFSKKKLMFTGGFQNISRSEAKAIVEKNGGKVLGTISKKLDYLIVGNSKPTKRKIDQAKQLNIKIIFEKEWDKILNS